MCRKTICRNFFFIIGVSRWNLKGKRLKNIKRITFLKCIMSNGEQTHINLKLTNDNFKCLFCLKFNKTNLVQNQFITKKSMSKHCINFLLRPYKNTTKKSIDHKYSKIYF